MRLALVGTGAIGGHLLNAIAAGDAGPIDIVAIADIPDRRDHLTQLARRLACTWHTDPIDVLSATPDIVVEAAAPEVVRAFAARWLDGGSDVLTMSVGALADAALLRDLSATAARTNRHVLVPSGAIGGLDAIRAARVGGLDAVELRTTKPPRALKGAPYLAAAGTDVDALTSPTVIFDGPASAAVVGFPPTSTWSPR